MGGERGKSEIVLVDEDGVAVQHHVLVIEALALLDEAEDRSLVQYAAHLVHDWHRFALGLDLVAADLRVDVEEVVGFGYFEALGNR